MNKTSIITLIILIVLIAYGTFYYRTQKADKYNTYYVLYEDARGLQAANGVMLKGVRIGSVKDVVLEPDRKVKVTLKVEKGIIIPGGTIAIIASDALTGDRTINLLLGKGVNLANNTILKTGLDSTLTESFHAKITPLLHTGKVLLRTTDSTMQELGQIMRSGWSKETQRDIANTSNKIASFARSSATMTHSATSVGKSIDKMDKSLNNPADKNRNMNQTIGNADKKTAAFAKKDIAKSLNEISGNLNKLSASVRNAGNNKMITDKAAYESTTRSLDTLQRSMAEYHRDPPPFQMIGGSKKK